MKSRTLARWLLVGTLATQSGLSVAALQHKILIIGVDGTMPSALAVANTPNLNTLKAQGCFSDRAVTHPVTHSAACWTSMFTGVWGDKHGVNDPGNSFTGNRLDLYPSFFKRLEGVNSNLNTVAFARWCPLLDILTNADVRQCFTSDDAITTATCQRLTNSDPDVLYTILLDVDSAGHSYGWGPGVTNYVNEIQKADTRIGRMMNALTNRLTYTNEDWLVIILSDHGQHDSTVEKSRVTFHLAWGPSAAHGTMLPSPSIVDVCATVLTHMGVPINPAWNLDARIEGLPLPPTGYGTNLLFNGDAESNSGTNNYLPDRGIAWWWDTGSATLGCYGSNGAFPSGSSAGPTNRGKHFFLGGTNLLSTVSQTINIADIADRIDDPGVDYSMSGWFGGKGAEQDCASLTARFLDDVGAVLATNIVGNVTAVERTNLTGLLERSATGTVPSGTHRVEFVLAFQAPSGTNDASADNLSFVLTAKSDPPMFALNPHQISGGWEVGVAESKTNRFYKLWRSDDLGSWINITDEASGNGGPLFLGDTNAPVDKAFYRVSVRRP